jgi:hypothetical protein
MDITEAQLEWIMGRLLLFGRVIGWSSITIALALLREEQVLGRLYWHLRTALDRMDRRERQGRAGGAHCRAPAAKRKRRPVGRRALRAVDR